MGRLLCDLTTDHWQLDCNGAAEGVAGGVDLLDVESGVDAAERALRPDDAARLAGDAAGDEVGTDVGAEALDDVAIYPERFEEVGFGFGDAGELVVGRRLSCLRDEVVGAEDDAGGGGGGAEGGGDGEVEPGGVGGDD